MEEKEKKKSPGGAHGQVQVNTIDLAARTDVGLKRTLNEDSFGILKDEFLYFVCDGMGGHAGGDFASSLVRDTVLDLFRYPLPREIKEIPVFLTTSESTTIGISGYLFFAV